MTSTHHGKCHCGAVEFTVTLENGLEGLRRCNCSLCRRKGAILGSVPLAGLTVTKDDGLRLYQWNTKVAKHWFCGICGIYTHHQRRSDPTQYGFNIGCFEEFDPHSYSDVPVGDGKAMSLEQKT